MKITVCDECKDDEKDVFKTIKNIDYCEDCYYGSEYYTPTKLEDDWGINTGRKLAKYDAFAVFDYESFQYYGNDSKKYADNFRKIFDILGIKGIEIIPDNTDDYAIIGFKKKKRNINKPKTQITS